ncbi:MAG: MBL fold metallo-hydrolase [Gorillibacterium sp.]|nr:MBL fold metallo-hydrolase [Gorillibacterium sp.]
MRNDDAKFQARPPAPVPILTLAFSESSDTTIRWLTGSGFLLNCHGTLIMIDPVLTMKSGSHDICELGMRLLSPLPIQAHEVPRLDAVLYTHTDTDHLAPLTARTLVRTGGVFGGTAAVVGNLKSLGVPAKQTQTLRIGETVRIGTVEITLTPADHPWQEKEPEKYGPPHGPEDCCGFLLRTPEGTIWLTGDTRFLPAHLQMGQVDVLLLDVSDDPYHLGNQNEIRLANHYESAILIPHHYGTYDAPDALPFNGDPAQLAPSITHSDSRLHILAPGEAFVLGG